MNSINTHKWELRQIDAWADGEEGWTWNESFRLLNVEIEEGKEKDFLMGYFDSFKARFEVLYSGDIYELVVKQDFRPILALVPID